MINHIKTLLLNRSAEECASRGLSFRIDPGFVPAKLPSELEDVRSSLVDSDSENVDAVLSAVLSLLSRIDMSKYIKGYDPRVDIPSAQAKPAVTGFTDEHVDFSRFNTTKNSNYLFSRTRDKTTDAILDSLYRIRTNDVDGHACLAALVLALVARLELAVSRAVG